MSKFIRKPTVRRGKKVIVITDGPSPLAEELEVIECASHELAWKTYQRLKKQQGTRL